MPSRPGRGTLKKGSRVDAAHYWHASSFGTWIAHFGVIWAELQCQVSPMGATATPSQEWLVTQSFRFGLDASIVAGWLPNTPGFWKVLAEGLIPAVLQHFETLASVLPV